MKKVSSEFAIVLILILSIFLGGIIWIQGTGSWGDENFSARGTAQITMPRNEGDKKMNEPSLKGGPSLSNWKTYEHEKLGVRVSCPEGYSPQVDVDKQNEQVFSVRKIGEKKCDEGTCALSVSVVDSEMLGKKAKTPEEFVDTFRREGKKFLETVIGGEVAYRYDNDNAYVVFLQNDNTYERYDFLIKEKNMGEKILETFKFAKK